MTRLTLEARRKGQHWYRTHHSDSRDTCAGFGLDMRPPDLNPRDRTDMGGIAWTVHHAIGCAIWLTIGVGVLLMLFGALGR